MQGQTQIIKDTHTAVHPHTQYIYKNNRIMNSLWVSEKKTVTDSESNGDDLETGGPVSEWVGERCWLTNWGQI